MDRISFTSTVDCKLENIGPLRRVISKVCHASGVQKSVEHKIITCFSEVANNIVFHTNPKAEKLHVELGHNLSMWWLKLTDDGGRDKYDTGHANPLSDAESGRGLFILNMLADKYIEKVDDQGRSVTIVQIERDEYQDLPSVLIVEDVPALSSLYRAYLEKNYDVSTASSGKEALDLIRKQTFSLILSDINMPEMDGFQLRQALLADPENEMIPFLFLTGEDDHQKLNLANQMIIDDCLQKPVERQQLINTIDRTILRKRQLQEQINIRLLRQLSAVNPGEATPATKHWRVVNGSRATGLGGGDFLLDHQLGSDRIIVLADVMGHDASAKFFAFSYAGFLRGLFAAMKTVLPPNQIMQELSNAVNQHELLQASMLTCCILHLQPGGKVTYCTAGHPPSLYISNNGTKELSTKGMLLGLMESVEYQDASVTLEQGERIAVFSDGLVESADSKTKRERLEQAMLHVFKQSSDLPLEAAVELSLKRFDEFATLPVPDDVSLLMLEPIMGEH